MEADGLVVDDPSRGLFRVDRTVMTSSAVLDAEMERVFERCWLYVGHESEVAEPGEYRRRVVAGRSVIFVRGVDGRVRVLHNSCPHRGAIVCRADEGVATSFQCFYHAWTFGTDGTLRGVPGVQSYPDGFDQQERSLVPVARVGSYRGFWFMCLDAEAEPLEDYLAEARELLDVIVDQSPSGRLRVVPGRQSYTIRANWKLLAENSYDSYHGTPTHHTYFSYLQATGGTSDHGDLKRRGAARPLGNGHACIEYTAPWGKPVARWVPTFGEEAREEMAAVRAQLHDQHGPERGARITDSMRNMVIFPNLVVNDIMSLTVRTFQPTGPDTMSVDAWALAPVEEQGAALHRRLQSFLEILGPAGFATPDDAEALESCQIGFASGGVTHNDISKGYGTTERDGELQMRSWWREWHHRMTGQPREALGDPATPTERTHGAIAS